MSTCTIADCYEPTLLPLQSYSDISGIGVVIGFVGTAYLVLLLVLANYIIAFDPAACPFRRGRREPLPVSSQSASSNWWRPNTVDVLCIRGIRSNKLFGVDRARFHSLQQVFHESILALCDVQIVTGLGILISGFILLRCSGLDAYHWQIIVYLAWFSTVTHLSGLTVLRSYLSPYPWAKYVRYILMLFVAVLLFVAAVPTGYFDWSIRHYGRNNTIINGTAVPASYAICYLNLAYGNERYEELIRNQPPNRTITPISRTGPWQAMVFSLTLLGFGFATRSIKLFRPLSKGVENGLRKSLSNTAQRCILKMASFDIHPRLARNLWLDLAVKPTVAVFLMLRLTIDLFSSVLCEIYWLLAILLWGSVKLVGARHIPDLPTTSSTAAALAEENDWTFGQLLPVILLIGPVFSFTGTFALYNMQRKRNGREMQRLRAYDVSLDNSAQNEDSSAYHGYPQQMTDNDCALPYPSEQHPMAGDGFPPSARQGNELLAEPAPFDKYLGSYEDAPWLPICITLPCFFIFGGTCLAFALAFNFAYDFAQQVTLYGIWVSEYGLMYLAILGYPIACVVCILLGLMLEPWLQAGGSHHTRRKCCYFFCCVFVYACYFVNNIIWFSWHELGIFIGYVGVSALLYSIYFVACLWRCLRGKA